MTRIRGDNGKFVQKSQEPRSVKSIRVTDSAWETLVVCQAKDCEFEGKWRGYSLPQQIS